MKNDKKSKIIGMRLSDVYPKLIFNEIELEEKSSKARTTFRLSKEAKRQMIIRIAEEGYGMRGKSKWISEAFLEFTNPSTWHLNLENINSNNYWKRVVLDVEMLKEKLVVDAVNLDDDIKIRLWKSAIDVAIYGSEMDEPEYLDISSASVLRAAIMWKISK